MIKYRLESGIEALANLLKVEEVSALREAVGMGQRTIEEVRNQVEGARYVSTARLGTTDELVGFARAISDNATNGYISTVMVAPSHQRKGIGRALMMQILEGRSHVRWVLHTRKEAEAFYTSLGFTSAPDMMWRERSPR